MTIPARIIHARRLPRGGRGGLAGGVDETTGWAGVG